MFPYSKLDIRLLHLLDRLRTTRTVDATDGLHDHNLPVCVNWNVHDQHAHLDPANMQHLHTATEEGRTHISQVNNTAAQCPTNVFVQHKSAYFRGAIYCDPFKAHKLRHSVSMLICTTCQVDDSINKCSHLSSEKRLSTSWCCRYKRTTSAVWLNEWSCCFVLLRFVVGGGATHQLSIRSVTVTNCCQTEAAALETVKRRNNPVGQPQ